MTSAMTVSYRVLLYHRVDAEPDGSPRYCFLEHMALDPTCFTMQQGTIKTKRIRVHLPCSILDLTRALEAYYNNQVAQCVASDGPTTLPSLYADHSSAKVGIRVMSVRCE